MKYIPRERAQELGIISEERGYGGGVWFAVEDSNVNACWIAFDDEDDCLRYAVQRGYHVVWVPFGQVLGEYLYENGNN